MKNNNLHKYSFILKQDKEMFKKNKNTKVIYKENELYIDNNEYPVKNDEIFYDSSQGSMSLCIRDTYVCIDIDISNKTICNLGGTIVLKNIIKQNLYLPKVVTNFVLFFETTENLQNGVGWELLIDEKILYDKEKKLLVFGNLIYEQDAFMLFQNAFVQLDINKQLQCIILTNININ
ncbi:MAG: hypothetical protein PHO33_04135 [Clostridia bacterium]|nr:hypothetical protein [Clostridia bacterium]